MICRTFTAAFIALALSSATCVHGASNASSKPSTVLTANHRLGTWKLNVAQSTFAAGRAVKSAVQTAEKIGDSIKVTNEAETQDGLIVKYGYTAKYDGKDYPFPNSPWDTISLELIDAYTSKAVFKRGGKVVQTTNITVSKDGKVLTLTTSGIDRDGKGISYREVFDRN